MIDPPEFADVPAEAVAVIHLVVPREEIGAHMRPAIEEVLRTVRAQGIAPTGPLVAHHLRIDERVFEFELGVPVAAPVAPAGRVRMGTLPAAHVARTTYHGPYDGLHAAWEAFDDWIVAQGRVPGPAVREVYECGPDSGLPPSAWRTRLVRPVH